MFKPIQRRLYGLGWMVMHMSDNMFIANANIGNIEVDKHCGGWLNLVSEFIYDKSSFVFG